MTSPMTRRILYFLISAGIVVLDRVTKLAVIRRIELHGSVRVISGFFSLTHIENQGAAFGIFNDSPARWKIAMLVAFSLVAISVVATLIWKNSVRFTSGTLGLALIFGGACGNLWDRLVRGQVTDFLLFYYQQYQWPAFNAADSAIAIGAGLLVLDIVLTEKLDETLSS